MSMFKLITIPADTCVCHAVVDGRAQTPSLLAGAAQGRYFCGAGHRDKGFTMIELVVTLILIGILAAVAIPRMNLANSFDEVGYRDQVIATLEFARKSAVAARRYVCAQRVGNSVSLTIDTAIPEGSVATTCPRPQNLNVAGSNSNVISPRGATALGGLTSVVFDPLGRATLTGGASLTVIGESVVTLTVDAGTGYVY